MEMEAVLDRGFVTAWAHFHFGFPKPPGEPDHCTVPESNHGRRSTHPVLYVIYNPTSALCCLSLLQMTQLLLHAALQPSTQPAVLQPSCRSRKRSGFAEVIFRWINDLL